MELSGVNFLLRVYRDHLGEDDWRVDTENALREVEISVFTSKVHH
jgi:hypothetical protein